MRSLARQEGEPGGVGLGGRAKCENVPALFCLLSCNIVMDGSHRFDTLRAGEIHSFNGSGAALWSNFGYLRETVSQMAPPWWEMLTTRWLSKVPSERELYEAC